MYCTVLSCTNGLTVQLLASDVHPSRLDAVISSYPHFFSSSSHKFTGRPTFFYHQGLTAAPAVTWLPKVASDHLLGLPLAWVGGGGTVNYEFVKLSLSPWKTCLYYMMFSVDK